jgi:pyruvate kinase
MSDVRPSRRGRTRFICTIGPPTLNRDALAKLRENGMDIARVNGAHGSLDDVRNMVKFLRENLPAGVEILLDLPGNKVRTDNIVEPIDLQEGAEFVIPPNRVTYRPLYTLVKPGYRISAADGAIQLDVVGVRGEDIVTKVVVGGLLRNRKGMNIRGIHDAMPFDFERDISLLNVAIELKVDYVGLSFVRAPEHVRRIKAQLVGTNVRAVAKVETAEAVELLPRILATADMIMLDRGDLEAEIGRENVPLAQKRIIAGAREAGVPVIVASQFMTSMMDKPIPFMAEVSDVANAVMDRADVLMLSEETAVGKFPYDCIGTMRLIAETVEKRQDSEYGAIILAAGPSTGFGSLTTNKHKCMLDVGGTTIVSHQLENLRACGIRDENVVVVTGHNHAQVEAYLRGEGFGGRFAYNPWYATTNMLVSTWLARPTENFLLVYGDIVFERGILADLLATPGDAVLAVDADSEMTPEDEKVRVERGCVVAASKELDPRECGGEFIGLARFSAKAARALLGEMDRLVKQGRLMSFLTEAVERLPHVGVPLLMCPTDKKPWGDNDGLADLEHSREKIFPRILAARRAAHGTPVA